MNRAIRIRKSDLFFYIAFGIFISMSMILDMAWFETINFQSFQLICFFMIVVFLTLDNLFIKRFDNMPLYLGILIIFTIVAFRAENIRTIILLVLFIISTRDISLDKILKESYYLIAFYLIITIGLFYLGVFDKVEHSFFRTGTNIFRSSLGFSYTAYASHYFLTLFSIYVYLTRNRKNVLISYLIHFAVAIWLYIETNTRTAFYATILLFVVAIFVRMFRLDIAKYKIMRVLLKSTFAICSFITFFIVLSYPRNISWINNINRVLNYRIAYSYDGLIRYGISMLGKPVDFSTIGGSQYFYVDSSYVQLILRYGFLAFIIIMILYTMIMWENVDKHNSIGILVIAIIAIRGITDPQIINLAYSPFLLSLGSSFRYFSERKKNYRKIYNKHNAEMKTDVANIRDR